MCRYARSNSLRSIDQDSTHYTQRADECKFFGPRILRTIKLEWPKDFYFLSYREVGATQSSGVGSSNGAGAEMMDCDMVISEFELESSYYVHFWTNTLKKSTNTLIPPAMG